MNIFYRVTNEEIVGRTDPVINRLFQRRNVSREYLDDYALFLGRDNIDDSLERLLSDELITQEGNEFTSAILKDETGLSESQRFYNYRSWLRRSGVLTYKPKDPIGETRDERKVMRLIGFNIKEKEMKPLEAIREAVKIVYDVTAVERFNDWYVDDKRKRIGGETEKTIGRFVHMSSFELTSRHYLYAYHQEDQRLVKVLMLRKNEGFVLGEFSRRYYTEHRKDLTETYPVSLYFRLSRRKPRKLVREILKRNVDEIRNKSFETLKEYETLAFGIIEREINAFSDRLIEPYDQAINAIDYPLGVDRLKKRYMPSGKGSKLRSMENIGSDEGLKGRTAIHLTEKRTLELLRRNPDVRSIRY